MTASRIPVPLLSASPRSATDARKPTATAPKTVNAGMYLFKMDSRTRGSRLKPGICRPLASICFACAAASMLAVFTHMTENIIEPIIIKLAYVMACDIIVEVAAPVMRAPNMFGGLIQYISPDAGELPEKVD